MCTSYSIDKNSHLIKEVLFDPSPNLGQTFQAGCPDTIVLHYTMTDNFDDAVSYLCDPKSKVSSHLVIGRVGQVKQLVPFNIEAWHAGLSNYNGRTNFNSFSIGIELENAGQLVKSEDYYLSHTGKKYLPSEVEAISIAKEMTFWHSYTTSQISCLISVLESLVQEYPIKDILAHSEIAPKRKKDPGPAFPFDLVKHQLNWTF